MVKCGRCGFDNPPEMKFCGNCGAKLTVAAELRRFEALASTHMTGSLYLILSAIFNDLVKASIVFLSLYIASAILGMYVGYEFYRGRLELPIKILSAIAIALGLVSTMILFIIGLGIRGVIGPAWIIFLVNAILLWRGGRVA
jgi:hypothetical protein